MFALATNRTPGDKGISSSTRRQQGSLLKILTLHLSSEYLKTGLWLTFFKLLHHKHVGLLEVADNWTLLEH